MKVANMYYGNLRLLLFRQKTFGKFALKEETPSKKLAAGSFFKERKKSREEPVPLKGNL